MFCINCGGTACVTELLAPLSDSVRECLRLVIIDSHRPIHHSLNDPDNSRTVILHDPEFDIDPEDIPVAEAVIEAEEGDEGATSLQWPRLQQFWQQGKLSCTLDASFAT